MIIKKKMTKKTGQAILNKAKSFFGPEGNGLTIASEGNCCITFTGGGGYLTVTIDDSSEGNTRIEVETREWDYLAKKFMETA